MEKEEIEAMWERIKALEENSLKVCKALGGQTIISMRTQMGVVAALKGKNEAFKAYMGPKLIETGRKVDDAQSVDEVIGLVKEFTADCVKFTEALLR